MFTVLAQMEALPEQRDTVIQALVEDGRGSFRDELGTVGFDVIQDAENPNRLYLHETSTSRAAFDTQCEGPHVQKAWAVTELLLAPPLTPMCFGLTIFPSRDDAV